MPPQQTRERDWVLATPHSRGPTLSRRMLAAKQQIRGRNDLPDYCQTPDQSDNGLKISRLCWAAKGL